MAIELNYSFSLSKARIDIYSSRLSDIPRTQAIVPVVFYAKVYATNDAGATYRVDFSYRLSNSTLEPITKTVYGTVPSSGTDVLTIDNEDDPLVTAWVRGATDYPTACTVTLTRVDDSETGYSERGRPIFAKQGTPVKFEVEVSDGVWAGLPTPSEWTCSWQDLSTEGTAGRTLDGKMHKDLVAVKRKNSLVWWAKDDSIAACVTQVSKRRVFIRFRYYDPFDAGNQKIITVYTGDITCTAQMAQGHYLWQVSLAYIEQ